MDKVRDKKDKTRMLGGNRITIATGLDKVSLLNQYEFSSAANYDPINTLLVMKMDPNDFAYKIDELDSRSLIQRRQALLSELKHVQVEKKLTEEQKFLAEHMNALVSDSSKMDEDIAKLVKKDKMVKFKPGLVDY